jgi:indoleamine 2,3-dioxygenase
MHAQNKPIRMSSDGSLSRFAISTTRGFLPEQDPLVELRSAKFQPWERAAASLPKLLVSDQTRAVIDQLPPFDPSPLKTPAELERAMMILSYLGHAYVWGGGEPVDRIPAGLAVPWHTVATRLGRPPVLSYPSYALHNWRRLDPNRGVELGNIALLQNFWGGADEEWFILVHVDIEARAAAAISAIQPAQDAAVAHDAPGLARHLNRIGDALDGMLKTLARMPELCDPYIYYHRVRPYIHGWNNNPALPNGLIYEGVSEYNGRGQHFRGETGAQSAIVPSLDAVLGVTHEPGLLFDYLMEMRQYMTPAHRAFIEHLEQRGPVVREVALNSDARTRDAYNRCVQVVQQFRKMHLDYAARYIHQQAQRDSANPTAVGTGGTPFMPYLKKHLDETGMKRIA